jgi:hypothetical protein
VKTAWGVEIIGYYFAKAVVDGFGPTVEKVMGQLKPEGFGALPRRITVPHGTKQGNDEG